MISKPLQNSYYCAVARPTTKHVDICSAGGKGIQSQLSKTPGTTWENNSADPFRMERKGQAPQTFSHRSCPRHPRSRVKTVPCKAIDSGAAIQYQRDGIVPFKSFHVASAVLRSCPVMARHGMTRSWDGADGPRSAMMAAANLSQGRRCEHRGCIVAASWLCLQLTSWCCLLAFEAREFAWQGP